MGPSKKVKHTNLLRSRLRDWHTFLFATHNSKDKSQGSQTQGVRKHCILAGGATKPHCKEHLPYKHFSNISQGHNGRE